jgi:hypothetical protein
MIETNVNIEMESGENGFDDTELDQTVNLNASYEQLLADDQRQKQNSEPGDRGGDELVDNIIDCSELDNDEDDNVNAAETNNNTNNNVSLYVPLNEQAEDDNVTFVIPEQLNRIGENVSICVLNEPESRSGQKSFEQSVSGTLLADFQHLFERSS